MPDNEKPQKTPKLPPQKEHKPSSDYCYAAPTQVKPIPPKPKKQDEE